MYRLIEGNSHSLADVDEFIGLVNGLPAGLGNFFDPTLDIFATRAPGRLDVMGGIADYSGSLVLQMPIAEGTFAAIQKSDDDVLKIVSLFPSGDRFSTFELEVDKLGVNGQPIDYRSVREYFESDRQIRWASYAAGVFYVLKHELGVDFASGAHISISSNVPVGKGVSSSAALEVAVMQAVCAAFDIKIDPLKLALLCQKVENEIVGAPCGVMDQVASNCASESSLISLRCQPAEFLGEIKIPDEIEFWGIDSGVRHNVSGSDYSSVRTGAFIGYVMIAHLAGMRAVIVSDGLINVDDVQWNGYLTNISPAEFERNISSKLPKQILGSEFTKEFGGTTDKFSTVEPDKVYSVKAPTAHAIYENFRVERFTKLLKGKIDEIVLGELGELMFESHASYTACGLGESGTDRLVELVRENRANGVFGARITGGGSGGTVAIIARRGNGSVVSQIAAQYGAESGRTPYIFHDSSPGCSSFGYLRLSSVDTSQK